VKLLILAHAPDRGAQAVANLLAASLGPRLMVLPPEWLGQAQWSQRLDGRGHASTGLRLPFAHAGGSPLASAQIAFVWNRIRLLPQAAFRASSARDQEYAGAELHALVGSWLAELGGRVEPPMRRHASVTPLLHRVHWAAVASRCGLALVSGPAAMETFSVLRTPLELCGPAAGALPASAARACHKVAAELGFALLSLGFCGMPAAPRLCRVDAHPGLFSPGEAHAVARWLSHCVDSAPGPSMSNTTELLA
jgi:hypothetical protein